jgi:hypothetical protein
MGMDFIREVEVDLFGNWTLADFLEKHGAYYDAAPAIRIPKKAILAAIQAAGDKPGLFRQQDIEKLKADMEKEELEEPTDELFYRVWC